MADQGQAQIEEDRPETDEERHARIMEELRSLFTYEPVTFNLSSDPFYIKIQPWLKGLTPELTESWNTAMRRKAAEVKCHVRRSFIQRCLDKGFVLRECLNTAPLPGFLAQDPDVQADVCKLRIQHAREEMTRQVEALRTLAGRAREEARGEIAKVEAQLDRSQVTDSRKYARSCREKVENETVAALKRRLDKLLMGSLAKEVVAPIHPAGRGSRRGALSKA